MPTIADENHVRVEGEKEKRKMHCVINLSSNFMVCYEVISIKETLLDLLENLLHKLFKFSKVVFPLRKKPSTIEDCLLSNNCH